KKQNKVLKKRKNNNKVDTKMLQIQQNYQEDISNKKQKPEENNYQKDMDFETNEYETEDKIK
ncbi:1515_t:CDS:1, partial [Gigaspora margarita]